MSLPVKHLGVPLKQGRSYNVEWKPLIDHMKERLDGWKGKFLSIAGRIVLINTVLSALLMYMMLYFFPQWVINKIDRIHTRFLGQGVYTENTKYHLFSWR